MPYAMVVVVEDERDEEVTRLLSHSTDGVLFVGEPWEVKPLDDGFDEKYRGEPEFGTLECFDQHPEK